MAGVKLGERVLCSVCQSPLRPGDGFCARCGAQARVIVCPSCDHSIDFRSRYCSHCGRPLRDPADAVGGQSPAPEQLPSAERKYVTLFCADIISSTDLVAQLDPEDAIARLEPALAAMRAAVHQYNGIVSNEQGDGLTALFGAPQANDNHSVQACLAALSLLERMAALGDRDLQVRIGIHSAYAVVRFIGGDLSRVYEASGPAAGMVNRLQSSARPGSILVSQSCHALASELIAMRALPAIELRGFPDPVTVYEVTGARNVSRWQARAARTQSQFVGREEEMTGLSRTAEEVKSGVGQMVALIGEPGIGKSRLAHKITSTLQQGGWGTIEVESDPAAQGIPYRVLRRLTLAAFQTIRENDPSFEFGDRPPKWPDAPEFWEPSIATILEQAIDDPAWTQLEPAMRRRLTIDAAMVVIERAVDVKPTVILIEDLHWADSESNAAIEALASLLSRRPLLVLMTSRRDGEPAWLARGRINRIRLAALGSEPAGTLVDVLVGDLSAAAELKARIQRHTGGVPLFIEEVVRRLAETGVLLGEVGKYRIGTTTDDLGIPPTVQGVIAARVDRLSRPDKELLQVASVIGRHISFRLLSDAARVPENTLRERLLTLGAAELLIEARLFPEREYEFPHELVRDVTYESILRETRMILHRRVLECLETGFADRHHELLETFCNHALAAQEWQKVERYGLLAARKSLARSAFRAAAGFFDHAMDAIDRAPPTPEREVKAIDARIEARAAFMPIGQFDRWVQLSMEAESRAVAIGDSRRELIASAVRAGALNFFGTPADAIEVGERVIDRAKMLGEQRWLSLAEYGVGQGYYSAGRFREAEQLLALPAARLAIPDVPMPPGTTAAGLRLVCLMMKSCAHTWLGEFDLALHHCLAAERIAAESGRPYDLVAAAYAHGLRAVFRGTADEAVEVLEAALDRCKKNEIRTFTHVVANQLGQAYFQQQRLAPAQAMLRHALEVAESIGHTITRVAASAGLAMTLARTGQVDEATALAVSALATARQQGYRGIEVQVQCALAAALADSHPAEAEDALTAAIALATTIGAKPWRARATLSLARLLDRSGDATAATREFSAAARMFEEIDMPVTLNML